MKTLAVTLMALWAAAEAKNWENCTEAKGAGSFACYTCYDLDGGSCDWGLACCKGSCWKLIDDDTSTVAKGCSETKKTGSSGDYDAGIKIEGNELKGAAYFCDGDDYCNAGALNFPAVLVVGVLSLIAWV